MTDGKQGTRIAELKIPGTGARVIVLPCSVEYLTRDFGKEKIVMWKMTMLWPREVQGE